MITQIVSTQHKDLLDIRWALSNVCNYKCAYCFPGSNEGNNPFPKNTDLLIKNFINIFDFYKAQGRTRFHLELLGGEPTMWSDLQYFIEQIKQHHDVYITLITNASRTLRWWQEYGTLIDNVGISLHEQSDVQHVIDVADTVYAYNKKITVRVLMDPNRWDSCVDNIEFMKTHSKHPWIIQCKEITPTANFTPVYTNEQREFFKTELKRIPDAAWFMRQRKLIRQGFIKPYDSYYYDTQGGKHNATADHLLSEGQIHFKGYMCNMGVESIYINYDGRIMSSCGQTLFNDQFNIFDGELNFSHDNQPVKCTIDSCLCPFETNVSKVHPLIFVKGISAAQVQ